MSILTRPLTYDDLGQMPEDGNRYELIDGELIVTPAPIPKHQEVVVRLVLLLGAFITARNLGKLFTAPCDVKLSEHDIVEPDLIFIRRERLDIIGPKLIDGAPDLLIEILSPSTRTRDELRKARLYAAAGVPEYWLVDPDAHTVRLYTLLDHRYELIPTDGSVTQSVVLAGLEVDSDALFADL